MPELRQRKTTSVATPPEPANRPESTRVVALKASMVLLALLLLGIGFRAYLDDPRPLEWKMYLKRRAAKTAEAAGMARS